jgi:hypothetical protein
MAAIMPMPPKPKRRNADTGFYKIETISADTEGVGDSERHHH